MRRVRVQTVMDDTYTGTMYAYCPITNSITLLEGSNDFRVLKSAFVSQLQVLEKDSSAGKGHENGRFSRAEPLIASVNMSSLARKEGKKSVNGLAPPAKGVGVTKEAQGIFDALSRTLPCRWAAKSIIVLDVVRVDEPYTVDACRAPENSTSALHRVRKVVCRRMLCERLTLARWRTTKALSCKGAGGEERRLEGSLCI